MTCIHIIINDRVKNLEIPHILVMACTLKVHSVLGHKLQCLYGTHVWLVSEAVNRYMYHYNCKII